MTKGLNILRFVMAASAWQITSFKTDTRTMENHKNALKEKEAMKLSTFTI